MLWLGCSGETESNLGLSEGVPGEQRVPKQRVPSRGQMGSLPRIGPDTRSTLRFLLHRASWSQRLRHSPQLTRRCGQAAPLAAPGRTTSCLLQLLRLRCSLARAPSSISQLPPGRVLGSARVTVLSCLPPPRSAPPSSQTGSRQGLLMAACTPLCHGT